MGKLATTISLAIRNDGRTWADIADAAGCHKSIITRFLQGGGLSIENADRLCRALGLTLTKKTTSRKRGGNRRH